MSQNDVITLALKLKPSERYEVIDELIRSLDMPDASIEEAWEEETKTRLELFQQGKLSVVTEEEFFRRDR